MKVNQSLREFRNHILFLLISGLVLVFGGTALALAQLSSYDPNASALLIGEAAGQIGFVLIALGIFGSFLRRTARAIIEGLGGSISEDASPTSIEVSAVTVQTSPQTPAEDFTEWLTPKQHQLWLDAGSPDLRPWMKAGRPNFRKWINDNS